MDNDSNEYITNINKSPNITRKIISTKNEKGINYIPNIIYMLLDDVGINDLNNADLEDDENNGWLYGTTPNLVQFAKEGVTLTNHFTGWV